MDRSSGGSNLARRTSDRMLLVIPIFAMLLCIFPVGPIGPPVGLILAVSGLLIARGRPPSRERTNLLVCSIMALIGTGFFTGALLIDWLR